MSKGSTPRPRQIDYEKYAENWKRIFGKRKADYASNQECNTSHCRKQENQQ